jgi:hypothetical protein
MRGRYDTVRADLTRDGVADLRLSPEQRSRVILALRQYYIRRKQDVRFKTKHLGDGLYRVWMNGIRTVRSEPRA